MHLCHPDEYEIIGDNGKECSDFHLVNDLNVKKIFLAHYF